MGRERMKKSVLDRGDELWGVANEPARFISLFTGGKEFPGIVEGVMNMKSSPDPS
jgi:hypothetical protein